MEAIPPPAIIRILADGGGTLGERQSVIDWLKRSGIEIRIIGICASACGWLLTLPRNQVCIAPGAKIGYHSHIGSSDDVIIWESGKSLISRNAVRSC